MFSLFYNPFKATWYVLVAYLPCKQKLALSTWDKRYKPENQKAWKQIPFYCHLPRK